MFVKRHDVTIVTDGSGDGTGYTEIIPYGEIKQVRYAKAGSGNYSDGVDIVVSLNDTGVIVWDEDDVNASGTRCPQQASHLNTTGAAATYDGTRAALRPIVVAGEKIKIVVASGGDTKTGTFYIWVGG